MAQMKEIDKPTTEFPPRSSQPLWSAVASQPIASSPNPIGSKSKTATGNSDNTIGSWHMIKTKPQTTEVGTSSTILNQNNKGIEGRCEERGGPLLSQMPQTPANQVIYFSSNVIQDGKVLARIPNFF